MHENICIAFSTNVSHFSHCLFFITVTADQASIEKKALMQSTTQQQKDTI